MGHFALGQPVCVKVILRWEGVARRSCLYYNTGHFPLGYLAMGKNVLSQINDMFIQKEVTTLFRSSTASRFLAKESFECERKKWNTLIRPTCANTSLVTDVKGNTDLQISCSVCDITMSGPNKSSTDRVHVHNTSTPPKWQHHTPTASSDYWSVHIFNSCLKRSARRHLCGIFIIFRHKK